MITGLLLVRGTYMTQVENEVVDLLRTSLTLRFGGGAQL